MKKTAIALLAWFVSSASLAATWFVSSASLAAWRRRRGRK
ncbi:hypothetical protein LTSESEN_3827 [Salmonella enterica subsp. enterica serovar Senftenberg str. A4-543]|uniref:Uncharacterized protein n=1 Tax=Salmonella enterica subsp. enterica serovar Senftenberg str. A4-543 TaxID=913082 RepID=G5R302_SALSE|nr:hypothetical protein LTSESEN_3827 [Salmonella enterica subsp. enterica serovar Senftenberg str. A4-543]